MNVTLPSSPLTTDFDTRLQRAGDGFLVTAGNWNKEGGSITRWVRSTAAGVLDPEVMPAGPPYQYLYGLAPAGKATSADQLIAISRGGYAPGAGEEVLAAVMNETTAVTGPTHVVLDALNAGQTIDVAVASSLDGLRAVFVDGNIIQQDPLVIVLGGDGVRQGDPVSVTTTSDHIWHCLDLIPTRTAGAVSTVEIRNGKPFWHLVEVDAAGKQAFEGSVDVTDLAVDGGWPGCPRIVLTKEGFTGTFVDTKGATVLLAIDRATFSAAGATWIRPSIAVVPDHIFAATGAGYAFLTPGQSTGSPLQVRQIDRTGHVVPDDLPLPLAPDAWNSLVPSAPGTLLIAARNADGPLGWLEITCDAP
jgi:hypothetical protein